MKLKQIAEAGHSWCVDGVHAGDGLRVGIGSHPLDRCSVSVRQIAIVSRAESLLLVVRQHLRFLEQGRDTRKRASGSECPWASQKGIAEHDCGAGVQQ